MRSFKPDLEARNTQVVLITFGTPRLAEAWIAETKTDFQFLIDPDRNAYQAFGLDYSLRRSWSPKIWFEYARLLSQGRRWRGIQGDSGQLGGDFIVDQSGIIRMAYRSHDPADRPSVTAMLSELDEINTHP